jgi:hypothetical protein
VRALVVLSLLVAGCASGSPDVADAEPARDEYGWLICPSGFTRCTFISASSACIDLANDAAHCGRCDVACEGGVWGVCRGGICR